MTGRGASTSHNFERLTPEVIPSLPGGQSVIRMGRRV
jgi:hypothetical protein